MIVKGDRPKVSTVGRVWERAGIGYVTGWVLGVCQRGCNCHRNADGLLAIEQDDQQGTLGLVKHRACACCSPWSYTELFGMVADLAAVEALATAAEPEPS